MPDWHKAQGIPGAGMRGEGGPGTGAGMASGAPPPGPGYCDAEEHEAKALVKAVHDQLAQAPGGLGTVDNRPEYDDSAY